MQLFLQVLFSYCKDFTIEQSAKGLRLLKDAGCEKIHFAGGKPFLHPILLGKLWLRARFSSEYNKRNGSLISNEWMEMYARYVDVLPETNANRPWW